jgi:uncharacterized protein (DUF2249 family)
MARKRKNIMTNERRKIGKTESVEAYSFRIFRYYINGIENETDLINRLSKVSNNVLQMLDDDGNFLLYRACQYHYYILAFMIWERYPNAAIYQKEWHDRNPLQIAIILHKKKHNMIHDALNYLLDNGYAAKIINQHDNNGNTPLHYSCMLAIWHRPTTFRKLLNQPGILVDVKNDQGNTPLHIACQNCREDILSDMIECADVDFNKIDNNGENAVHHLIQGYIKNSSIPNKRRNFLHCMNIILKKYPHLASQQNRDKESSYKYACIIQKSVVESGLAGSFKLLNCSHHYVFNTVTLDVEKQFWSSLIKTLHDYQTESKFRMYQFFINNAI